MMTARSPDANVTGDLLAFVERTLDLVGVLDDESRVLYLNEAARKRIGVGDSTGLTSTDVFPPQTFAQYYDEIRPALLRSGVWRGELAVLTGSGEAVPMVMTIVGNVGPGGEVKTLVSLGREIETQRPAVPTSDVVFDELTGLPGRAILNDRMQVALAHVARGGHGVAVILVDVDAMKDINDSFGHAAGDEVLCRLAEMLSRGVRTSDTVARVGGDEFVVLLDGLEEADTAWQVTERLRDAVCGAPDGTGGDRPEATASFGLAIATPDDAPAELLHRADAAMYRSKAKGGAGLTVFEGSADVSITALADELAVAVSHGQIRPHVQPVVDLRTGALVGYQGLARWQHPQRGLLDAEEFVHVVASTPLLPVIDLAVLRWTAGTANRDARGRHVRTYGHISRRLLGHAYIERFLAEIIDEVEIAPSDLCVEIAHGFVARPSRTVESALRALRELGVRVVLSGVDDDCEVNELVKYGFDELRLARRLVHDAGRDPIRRRVALGTVALAHALGLEVIAVGVENDMDRDQMRDAGCDYAEGNLFGLVQPAGAVA
jgi:diguanylate cyclase (GGDEF)-like protein